MKRYIFGVAACLTLFGCSGGGGSNGSGTTPPAATSAAQQTQVQRALAEQSLSGVQAAGLALSYGGSGSAPTALAYKRQLIVTAARKAASAYHSAISPAMLSASAASVSYGACSNGTESAQSAISLTEMQLYVKVFYDTACTNLFESTYFDIVASSLSSATGHGNGIAYASNGTAVSYQTFQLALTGIGTNSETVSVVATDAASQTSPQLGTVGIACSLASSTIGCGFGGVVHSQTLNQDLGESITLTISASMANSRITVPMTANGSGYSGSLNALSLTAGTFPVWTIAGGTTIDTASMNGEIVYNTVGLPLSGSLTATDALNDASAVLTLKGTQINGAITQTSTGKTVATVTVDQYGNGTITYANGTTGQISQWQVLA